MSWVDIIARNYRIPAHAVTDKHYLLDPSELLPHHDIISVFAYIYQHL